MFSDLALSTGNAVHADRPRRSGAGDRPAGLGCAAADARPATSARPQFLARRRSARRRARRAHQPRDVADALQSRSVGAGTGDDAGRRAVHHHRRPARGRHRISAQSAPDLGAAAGRGAVSRAVAIERRRLLLSSHRAAEAGRVAGAGAGGDERRSPRVTARRTRPTSTRRRRSTSCRCWTMRSGSSGRAICCCSAQWDVCC